MMQVNYFTEDELSKTFTLLEVDGEYQVWRKESMTSHRRLRKSKYVNPLKLFRNKDGYSLVKIGSRNMPYHRLLWTMVRGEIPEGFILNHILPIKDKEGNIFPTRDNIHNLELTTNRGNQCKGNKQLERGYYGIHLNKRSGNWSSCIQLDRKQIQLGTFKDMEGAQEAYNLASRMVEDGKSLTEISECFKIKRMAKKGYTYAPSRDKWVAYVTVEGKSKHLGYFTSEKQAADAVLNFKTFQTNSQLGGLKL